MSIGRMVTGRGKPKILNIIVVVVVVAAAAVVVVVVAAAAAKGKKVKLSLCITQHHAMKTYRGSGGIAPCILDCGTRWR
jgi:flagellar basal body-associated protein FliL